MMQILGIEKRQMGTSAILLTIKMTFFKKQERKQSSEIMLCWRLRGQVKHDNKRKSLRTV